jgi:hypothetical protein
MRMRSQLARTHTARLTSIKLGESARNLPILLINPIHLLLPADIIPDFILVRLFGFSPVYAGHLGQEHRVLRFDCGAELPVGDFLGVLLVLSEGLHVAGGGVLELGSAVHDLVDAAQETGEVFGFLGLLE